MPAWSRPGLSVAPVGGRGYAVSYRAELPVGATQTALAAVFLGAALAGRAVWTRVLAQRRSAA